MMLKGLSIAKIYFFSLLPLSPLYHSLSLPLSLTHKHTHQAELRSKFRQTRVRVRCMQLTIMLGMTVRWVAINFFKRGAKKYQFSFLLCSVYAFK